MKLRSLALALLLIASALCPLTVTAMEATIPEHLVSLFPKPGEPRLARAFVPSPERKVGEIRLLHVGDADVVQTVLYTTILRRVVGEIRKKEMSNWPEGDSAHVEAERYVEALSQAQQDIWRRLPKGTRGTKSIQKLLIEFAVSPEVGAVLLSEYSSQTVGGEVEVNSRRPLAILELDRSYVIRNMRLIVADAFKVDGAALEQMLEGAPLLRSVSEKPTTAPRQEK